MQEEARKRLWFVDNKGLVVADRDDLAPHNLPYAHNEDNMGFLEAIEKIKPNVLIGATGAPGTFNEAVVGKMSEINEQPVIFALSNPTSRAECTAEQAYLWSGGRVLFASGSPFGPVVLDNGEVRKPGQGNNAYVFPGIGLGALAAKTTRLPESMFLAAADALASYVTADDLAAGALYPPLSEIRSVSVSIAAAVVRKSFELGLSNIEPFDNVEEQVKAMMYNPAY